MRPRNPQRRVLTSRAPNRKGFLKLGGSALAGTALLGSGALADCGGGGDSESGVTEFAFSFGPDDSASLQKLIGRFNRKYEGRYKANYRVMSADTDQ